MKKYLLTLIAIAILVPAGTFVHAEELSLAQLVELFISLEIIPPEKATQARSALTSVDTGSSSGSGGTCESVTITRWLTIGATGTDVTALQTFLAKFPAWYPEGITSGYFGELSERAVQRYQAAKGLVSSGSPTATGYGATGPQTRASLAGCHTRSGTSAIGTGAPAVSTIITPAAGAVYPLDQLGLITIRLSASENIATQARFYIIGGGMKKWKLLGTEQFNYRPDQITHTFSPAAHSELVPDTAYAILVSVDEWNVDKYENTENINLPTPLFFSKAAATPLTTGATIFGKSIVSTPARGAVYSLDQPVSVTTKLRSLTDNTATQARFYALGGLLGSKDWTNLGTVQSIYRPADMTLSFNPRSVTYIPGRNEAPLQALENGVAYSIAVSIDGWDVNRYLNQEEINLLTPLYFSDNVAHGVLFSPSRGLSSDDTRWRVFDELRGSTADGDISVDAYDLNDDGVDEVFGYSRAAGLCSGALCPLSLYQRFGSNEDNYRWQSFFFADSKSIQTPEAVMVLNSKTNGWKDIAVLAPDGLYNVWRYDGGAYRLTHKVTSLLPGLMEVSTASTGSSSNTSNTTSNASNDTGSLSTIPPPPPPPPAL